MFAADAFAGRVVLVSGGTRGIGAQCARELVQLGASVAVSGRESAQLGSVVRELRALAGDPGRVIGLPADIASVVEIRAMVAAAGDYFGHVDVLINSAGTNIRSPALDVTEDEWDTVMNVNLRGTFFTSQAFAATITSAQRGKIINISSQYGHIGSANRVVYSASKGGVELMTKSLAVEWAPRLLVNTVCPTFIETDLTRGLLNDPAVRSDLLARIPLGRFGEVADVTGAVLYLVSDLSNMVTGTALMVDGGWTAA